MRYMIIDVATVEGTSIVAIAPTLQHASLMGRLLKADGRKVIGPPVEGRGFAKLGKLPLQYLYWNICKEAPPEDYGELVQNCLTVLRNMPVDETPIAKLELACSKLEPEEGYNTDNELPVKPKEIKPPKTTRAPGSAPKSTSVTGLVWVLCDEVLEASGGVMPARKIFIDKCLEEGINPATAATQYAKWKGSKQ